MFGIIIYAGLVLLIPCTYLTGVLLGIEYERRRRSVYVKRKKAEIKQCMSDM